MTAEKLPHILTVAHIMELTGLSRGAVYKGAASGEIPCRRVGRRYVFVRDTVLRWLSAPSSPRKD